MKPTTTNPPAKVSPPPAATGTYAAAYAQLAGIADKLRASTTPAVDSLVEDLRAARAAYGVCRDRLAAVRAEIEAEIAVTETETP